MRYSVEHFPNGEVSLKDHQVSESMHSLIGPWNEAKTLYINQSELLKKLCVPTQEPLILYDVGLGIAANALAAVELFTRSEIQRELHIISFENSIVGIEFALQNSRQFQFLENNRTLVASLLKSKSVESRSLNGMELKWNLILGDFRYTLLEVTQEPEVIFYDFYSPKANPELWNTHCFQLLYDKTQNRREMGLETSLYTYSSATSARTAMLLAGFYVGHGVSTQGKRDTTVASTQINQLKSPLNQDWLNHWKRSSKPLPCDVASNQKDLIYDKILEKIFFK